MRNIFMRRNAAGIFLVVLLSLFAFTACDVRVTDPDDRVANTNYAATESFSFAIAVKNQTRLVLGAINGPVDVVGVPNAVTARIWGERRVESESATDAKARLNDLEVRVSDRQDEISVQTLQPDDTHGRNYIVVYHLRIPQTWKLSLGHVNGAVTIDSLNNDVSVKLVNGNVQVREIYGNLTAEVINGQVTGNLTLPVQGTCKASTVNGLITLSIPRTTTAEFSAAVTNGNIQVTNLALDNMVSTPQSVRGKLGNGQGTIALSTVNGNISVNGF